MSENQAAAAEIPDYTKVNEATRRANEVLKRSVHLIDVAVHQKNLVLEKLNRLADELKSIGDSYGYSADEESGDGALIPLDAAIAAVEEILESTPQSTPQSDWKAVVIDEMVTAHLPVTDDTDPRQALHKLIRWHVSVALDPAVSEDAAKLRDTFKADSVRLRDELLILTNALGASSPELMLYRINSMKAEINAWRDKEAGNTWYWQGDGEDHPESLTCPVLIHPADLRAMLADRKTAIQSADAAAIVSMSLRQERDRYRETLEALRRAMDSGAVDLVLLGEIVHRGLSFNQTGGEQPK